MEINSEKIDEQLKQSLLKRACGYDYEEKIVEANPDGRPVKIKIVKKHMPPDVTAINQIIYLKETDKW